MRFVQGPLQIDTPPAVEQDSVSLLWVRDEPSRALDYCSLTALCDVFSPRIFVKRASWVPIGTVSIAAYFHADAVTLAAIGTHHLLGHARAHQFRNGYFDQSGELWGSGGELLAVNFGTALVGGLSGLQGMLSGSTGAAAVGNVNMGNVAMDQMQLAPNRTSAFMSSWQNDLSGNTFSSSALTGRTAVSLLRNQGYASRVVSMRVSEQDVQDASRQVDAARGEAVAASTERSAVLSEAFSRGLSKLRSTRNTTGSTSSSFEQLGQTLNRLDQITKSVADRTGLTQSQVAQIAFGAAAHVGISTPFAGADARANAGKNYQSSLSAEQQKVLGSLTSEQLAEFKQFGDRVSRDTTVMNALSSDSRESKDLSSRLASAVSRTTRADAAVAERTALAERLSAARERGETIAIDTAQDPHQLAMFLRFAEQYGGNSASALALFEAELARQGLPPNRTFSDGTALPSSFGDIRRLHAGAADPTLAADIDAQASTNRGKVSARATPVPFAASRTTPSGLRSEVEALGVDIRQQVRSDSAAVDARTETVSTPDGTLQSRKSLLKQAGKQVAKDASASVDNATEIVTDMFRKKK